MNLRIISGFYVTISKHSYRRHWRIKNDFRLIHKHQTYKSSDYLVKIDRFWFVNAVYTYTFFSCAPIHSEFYIKVCVKRLTFEWFYTNNNMQNHSTVNFFAPILSEFYIKVCAKRLTFEWFYTNNNMQNHSTVNFFVQLYF